MALPEEHRPPTPPERIRQEYALRRRRQAASGVPVVILAIAVALGSGGGGVPVLVVGTVILAFFGFSLVNWRCPSCGAYLGQRLNPERCPACRVELRD